MGRKKLYEYFKRQTNKISYKKTWTHLRKGDFKRGREYILLAAQSNTIRTNYVKVKMDKTQQNKTVGYVMIKTKQ